MNTFFGGIIVGFVLFAVIAIVAIFNKTQQEMAQMSRNTDAINKTLQMLVMRLTRVEKTTMATMNGIETFIDGLRQTSEIMFSKPPYDSTDNFDDLKTSFEDGIKRFEDEMGTGEDIDDENKEDWQK